MIRSISLPELLDNAAKMAMKKRKVKFSQYIRVLIEKDIKEQSIDYVPKEPKFIVLARCPFCNDIIQTNSVSLIWCVKCQKHFRLVTKKYGTRIHKVPKGEKELRKRLNRFRF